VRYRHRVPELPEVEAVRRQLEPVMSGTTILDVELRRPDLRTPFPPRFCQRLRGAAVLAVKRRAKYLLVQVSSGDTLLMHLGMSGSFHVDADAPAPAGNSRLTAHDHVIFHLDSGAVVIFNDPRRFGFMDLLDERALREHQVLSRLGPEPLSGTFTPAALARACRARRTTIKVALLDQRIVAGIGNIYASEALHLAGISPRRRAGALATPGGTPRKSAEQLTVAIKRVLNAAVRRVSSCGYRGSPFKVYEREGQACLLAGCGGTIRRFTQAGRSTFYCPLCQR
jgi:formamidopyrimidine-DNA glycosylase